jgi:hypothetical protein
MTVAELIKKLYDYDPTLEVYITDGEGGSSPATILDEVTVVERRSIYSNPGKLDSVTIGRVSTSIKTLQIS